MATRSRIGMDIGEGQIRSVYCHWDGYPEGVGVCLLEEHNTEEAATALIDRGDLSTIMGSPVAYHLSRGEPWDRVKPQVHGYALAPKEEYFYLWRDGEWWVSGHNQGPLHVTRLADVLKADSAEETAPPPFTPAPYPPGDDPNADFPLLRRR